MPDNIKPGNYSGGLWNQLFEKWFAQYGDHDRAVAAAKAEFDEIASMGSASQSFESSIGGVEDYLRQILSGGNPLEAQQRQMLQGEIGRATQRSVKDTMNALGRSGMGRSGAGYGVLSDIYSGQSEALAKGNLGISEMGLNMRNDAIAKLLGIGQARAGFFDADRAAYANAKQQAFGMQTTERPRKPTFGSALGQLLPTVLSTIAAVAGAFGGSGDTNGSGDTKPVGTK